MLEHDYGAAELAKRKYQEYVTQFSGMADVSEDVKRYFQNVIDGIDETLDDTGAKLAAGLSFEANDSWAR